MKISVIGTGYLGATHAACLASLGHDVTGVDVDRTLVDTLSAGHAPFHEPGLDALLVAGRDAGRLRFTTSVAEAAAHARVHFLCVGTPQSGTSWATDTSALETAVDSLLSCLADIRGRDDREDRGTADRDTADVRDLVVGKSTVPAGTARRLAARLPDQVQLCWSPEFLREGHGIADTLRPDRLVLGVEEPGNADAARAEAVFREIFAVPLETTPLLVTDLVTAELVKSAANAFLATKISFINAVADVCAAAGADVGVLADALGRDPRIGPGALNPGPGFGGGCLPKDLRGFADRAAELGADEAAALFRTVDAVNTHRRSAVVEQAAALCGGTLRGRRIAVLGAAFKAGSDDVRESPALAVVEGLRDAGAQVSVADPEVPGCLRSAADAVAGATLVVVATDWQQFRDLDPAALRELVDRPVVLDARYCLPAPRWRAAGWDYRVPGVNPASTASTAS